MQVLSINEINDVAGAMEVSAFGYTLSNGGNNANSFYQAGVWGVGGAIGGGLTAGPFGAAVGGIGGAFSGFAGSFTLTN